MQKLVVGATVSIEYLTSVPGTGSSSSPGTYNDLTVVAVKPGYIEVTDSTSATKIFLWNRISSVTVS